MTHIIYTYRARISATRNMPLPLTKTPMLVGEYQAAPKLSYGDVTSRQPAWEDGYEIANERPLL